MRHLGGEMRTFLEVEVKDEILEIWICGEVILRFFRLHHCGV